MTMAVDQLELVVITGMSGAGKTVAMQSFEDMGYFCVDSDSTSDKLIFNRTVALKDSWEKQKNK